MFWRIIFLFLMIYTIIEGDRTESQDDAEGEALDLYPQSKKFISEISLMKQNFCITRSSC